MSILINKNSRFSAFIAAVTISGPISLFAAGFDWPQWQGPDRNAVSKETGLLKEWPKEGPPLVWKIKGLGGGYGGPSIAGGRIYGMSNRNGDEFVWSLSETDGKEVWAARLGPALTEGMPQGKEGAGCSPTVDGDRLYVLGQSGDLACLQAKDGSVIWRRGLAGDFGGVIPTWRYNESPLVDGDKVVCTPGGKEATLVALNKLTGETIWKTKVPDPTGGNSEGPDGGRRGGGRPGFRDSGAAYASAIAIDFEGQRQYVQLTAKSLVGVASSDGKLLWRYDRPASKAGINCSTPLYHDGMVFAASAYGTGGGLVKLSKDGNGGIKANEVWFSKNMENHHGGVLVIDGALYGSNGGNGGGYLACLDFKTGDVLWNERDPDKRRATKGSVAFADDRIYYRTEQGAMLLIEPSTREYLERGRFEQPDRTKQPAWTHPVLANGKLFIRDQDALFCYDVKAK
ncbi:MAG TPA: PQQ-binding-like beta-propeller repeat protein [Verrucomicrobiae bacterium]|nr:PQQ-binding-like beta-propeller repeat protein [Verrucomicrobiae bacterium]